MCIDGRLDRLSLVCESWPREAAWLVRYIKDGRFAQMMDDSLRGDRHRLDRFVGGLKAVPRGTVVHWLSGNVPVLSILSALMSIVTGNRTILKLSKHDAGLTKQCLKPFDVEYVTEADATSLSKMADVRVAWGGYDAVDAISKLPHKWDCQDIVFGPKLSLALVDRDNKTCNVAHRIAVDVASLDQMGCNSCQTVVVEGNAMGFACMIASELKRLGGAPFVADRWGRICQARCEHYDGKERGKYSLVLGPAAPKYTVLYKYAEDVPDNPAMGRTLYVRTVNQLSHVVIPEGTQTIGVTEGVPTLPQFDQVDRAVPVGQMTAFSVPWDGMYPVERMIRWVSCTTSV